MIANCNEISNTQLLDLLYYINMHALTSCKCND